MNDFDKEVQQYLKEQAAKRPPDKAHGVQVVLMILMLGVMIGLAIGYST